MRQYSGRQMYTHTTKEEQTRITSAQSVLHKQTNEQLTRTEPILNSQTSLRKNCVVPTYTPKSYNPNSQHQEKQRCKQGESRNYVNRIDRG